MRENNNRKWITRKINRYDLLYALFWVYVLGLLLFALIHSL